MIADEKAKQNLMTDNGGPLTFNDYFNKTDKTMH